MHSRARKQLLESFVERSGISRALLNFQAGVKGVLLTLPLGTQPLPAPWVPCPSASLESLMDRWLNNGPALIYANGFWIVINKRGFPIMWTEDPQEAAWLSDYVSGLEIDRQRQAQFTKKRAPVLRGRSRVA